MHACYVLACTGPYCGQIWLDQKDQGIYGIRRTKRTCLRTQCYPSTQLSVHAHYVPACTEPYLGQIMSDFKEKVSMEYKDYSPHVWTYSGSFKGARGPRRRPMASHRGQRHTNCPPQELEIGRSGCPNILVFYIYKGPVFPLKLYIFYIYPSQICYQRNQHIYIIRGTCLSVL